MKLSLIAGICIILLIIPLISAFDLGGYVEKDVFLEGSIPELIECPYWMGCSVEVLTKENVMDARVQLMYYTEDPVGEPVPATIPFREWYDVSLNQETSLSLDHMTLKLRIPGAGGIYLKGYQWNEVSREWEERQSEYDRNTDIFSIISDRPGMFTVGVEFTKQETGETVCIKERVCGEWDECLDGKQFRECREMDPCDMNLIETVESQSCEAPEEISLTPSGMISKETEIVFTWILVVIILVFVIIILVFDLAGK
jgi:hypothetical protein